MNIAVALGIVVSKSLTVFVFFVLTVPVAVIIMVVFKNKIKLHNRQFRKDMEETSVRVMEMVERFLSPGHMRWRAQKPCVCRNSWRMSPRVD